MPWIHGPRHATEMLADHHSAVGNEMCSFNFDFSCCYELLVIVMYFTGNCRRKEGRTCVHCRFESRTAQKMTLEPIFPTTALKR